MDLCTDVTLAVARAVPADHRWVAALIGRAVRDAVRATGPIRTMPAGALASLARYELAVACGCPWTERRFREKLRGAKDARAHLGRMTRLAVLAARSGDCALLERLRAEGCVWDARTCAGAAAAGQLATLQWARAHGCCWDVATSHEAARGGHLEVLQWALENGCAVDANTCAAGALHIPVLAWLRLVACPWDAWTCAAAAAGGNLDALRWARANGCPWTESTCDAAAAGGHLQVLQWARAEGCPWTVVTAEAAAAGQHVATLRWMIENACPIDYRTLACVGLERWIVESGHLPLSSAVSYQAARNGDLELLQWLRARGCEWYGQYITELAAQSGNLAMLQWARAEGCAYGTCIHAKTLRYPRVVEWLLANGCRDTQLRNSDIDHGEMPDAETLQLLLNAGMWRDAY